MPCDLLTVATLHDLSVLLHPEWHPADRVAAYEREFRAGLARTAHVITVSEFARQEIVRVLGLPPERVTRVYNGVKAEFHPLPAAEVTAGLRRLGLPPEYLLYVGTLEPRKNLLTLMHAYCSPARSGAEAGSRCCWPAAGAGGPMRLADYLKCVGESHGVRHVGYVADADLPVLYNGARRWRSRRSTRGSGCRRWRCWPAAAPSWPPPPPPSPRPPAPPPT